MGISERKKRYQETVKANIMTAARQMALKDGWQNVSMRKLAEAIEYSPTVIYQHFENKDALLSELQIEGFRLLQEMMLKVKSYDNNLETQLLNLSLTQWEFANKNPELYQVMFNLEGAMCQCSNTSKEMNETGNIVIEIFKQITNNSQEEFIDELFSNWWVLMYGFIALSMSNKIKGGKDREQVILINSIKRFIKSIL